MKYYIEEETRDLRLAVEGELLSWPKVEARRMMGCPSYLAGGKIFASLVTGGMLITKLTEEMREELNEIAPVKPFNTGSRTIKRWAHIKVGPERLSELIPFLKASYEQALREANT